jgi:peptidoglycan hydrolase-like protein with peptidoglycan-binding domain
VVVAAQTALSRYGYDPGPADGRFTSSTKEALQQFQQARGIRATGELDSQTVAALGLER